jgi:hypothetical protein
MPATVELKGDIVEVLWSGAFHLGDVSESLSDVSDILDSKKSVSILIKESVSVFHFDAQEARQVAYLLEELKKKGAKKTGFVVSKQVHYGIGRMISAFCDMSMVEFEIFWDEESALQWLRSEA